MFAVGFNQLLMYRNMVQLQSNGTGLLALTTFAAVSLGFETALLYQRSQMLKQVYEARQVLRNEKKKHRLRFYLVEKPLAIHKVTADLAGDRFIKNLEQVKIQRITILQAQAQKTQNLEKAEIIYLKCGKQKDNIFKNFMALCASASL